MDQLKYDHLCFYEEKDNIGKRYRRQDAIGTPFCITVDHDTMNDNKVTIRDRDTMAQERVSISEVAKILNEKVDIRAALKDWTDSVFHFRSFVPVRIPTI